MKATQFNIKKFILNRLNFDSVYTWTLKIGALLPIISHISIYCS